MTEYAKLVEEFFTRYQEPTVDDLIIGFSGIDPPLKVSGSEINHEYLDNLLGGETLGHYHLTREQWEKVAKILENEPDPGPEPYVPNEPSEFDGGFSNTTENEYKANSSRWLDGGFVANNQVYEVDGGLAA